MQPSESAPLLCWKHIYDSMANAANTRGNPTSVSHDLHTFYLTHMLPYQRVHPEDVSELLCPLCSKSEAPPGATHATGGQPKWNQVWEQCGNSNCSLWLHKACAKAEATCKRVLKAAPPGADDGERSHSELRYYCHACFKADDAVAELEAAARERRKPDEKAGARGGAALRPAPAPRALAAGRRHMQLLPARPNMSGRVFSTHRVRCVPQLESAERCDQLLRDARDMLSASGLTAELVAASLGFARDDMDVSFKTVALLLSGDAVLSALVFCEDAHGNAAQILVAGTAQQARRTGCMRQLLRESADWLAAKGVLTLCVGTTRANTDAGAVYTRLGFVPSPNGQWPPGMVAKRTSSDLRCVYVLSSGQPAAGGGGGEKRITITPEKGDSARRARGAADALPLKGPPAEWPGEVPFTSGCVWEGLPQKRWPQVPCHDVVVKRIKDPKHPCYGRYGVFARRDLVPAGDFLAYGGFCRPASESSSLFLADLGGGLDVDSELCGNEARYLNHFAGIAARANTALKARQAPLSGSRYVGVRLLTKVDAGEELLLDYGPNYSPRSFADAKQRRAAAVKDATHEDAAAAAAAATAPPPRARAKRKRKAIPDGEAARRDEAPAAPDAPDAPGAPGADDADAWARFDPEPL